MNHFFVDMMLEEFGFDPNTVEITDETIKDCSHPGPCDFAVDHWSKKLDLASKMRRGSLKASLKQIGAWTMEELDNASDELNCQRALWIICCDAKEELDCERFESLAKPL